MEFKLFMILLGCKPKGRYTEQHDIFFGIARSLKELVPQINASWKNSGKIHIDAWRVIQYVDGHQITIVEKEKEKENKFGLFFINLGGYKPNCFDEFHYKMLTVATLKADAIKAAKKSAFYLHTGFGKLATSHIDDKYGVDVDDIFDINDILSTETKNIFSVKIATKKQNNIIEDDINLGYFKLENL